MNLLDSCEDWDVNDDVQSECYKKASPKLNRTNTNCSTHSNSSNCDSDRTNKDKRLCKQSTTTSSSLENLKSIENNLNTKAGSNENKLNSISSKLKLKESLSKQNSNDSNSITSSVVHRLSFQKAPKLSLASRNLTIQTTNQSNMSISKSASFNHSFNDTTNDTSSVTAKTEEQLQREYLGNLLNELQNEKKPSKCDYLDIVESDKYKSSKRSRSEAHLTLNSILPFNKNLEALVNKDKNSNYLKLKEYQEKRNSISNFKSNFLDVNNKHNTGDDSKSIGSYNANGDAEAGFSFRNLFKRNSSKEFGRQSDSLKKNGSNYSISKLLGNSTNERHSSLVNNEHSLDNTKSDVDFLDPAHSASQLKLNNILRTSYNNLMGISDNDNQNNKSNNGSNGNLSFNLLTVNRDSSKRSRSISNYQDDDFDKIFTDYYTQKGLNKNEFNYSDYNKVNSKPVNASNDFNNIKNGTLKHSKNPFRYFFKSKRNQNSYGEINDQDCSTFKRTKTLDYKTKSKLIFFSRNNTLIKKLNKNNSSNVNSGEKNDQLINETNSNNSNSGDNDSNNNEINSIHDLINNELDLKRNKFNLDLFRIEKKLHKTGSVMKSNETIYLDASTIIDKSNKYKLSNMGSSLNSNSTHKFDLVSSSTNLETTSGKLSKSRTINEEISSNKNNKSKVILNMSDKKSSNISCFIDVSFEKLQQNLNGHLISINLKNLRCEPLIEINCIKAKLSYLSVELIEANNLSENSDGNNSHNFLISNNITKHMNSKNVKFLAKVKNFKSKKCKFDKNLKNFSKPLDFDLINEHFMSVTEEAMNLQMKKLISLAPVDSNNNHNSNMNFENKNDKTKTYLFVFSVEIHSYLPVSRKILSSTFRKKKRIFKGQCQIHENFINSTQFTKEFCLNEV